MERVVGFSLDCCAELFADYGLPLVPGGPPVDPAICCAVVGFAGPTLRGCVVLGATIPALEQTSPIGGEWRPDWAGELANQLAGRLKNRLLRHGVEVAIGTPAVVGTHEVPGVLTPGSHVEAVSWPAGVWMWVATEALEGFVLTEEEEAPVLDEGDAMFFF